MNCPKCGAQLFEGSTFCGGCGYRLSAASANPAPTEQAPGQSRTGIHIDEDSGEVTFAPGAPGDIAAIEMMNQSFFVQSSSYLAGDASPVS